LECGDNFSDKDNMQQRKIVLASKSVWRKKLLEQIGLEVEVRESEYEEDMNAIDDPHELVKFLALKKAEDVAKHYDDAIVIGGDTFTIFNDKFIGKPKDADDAKRILRNFSGKEHEIVSGFAIIDTKNKITINDVGKALVRFRELSDEEIADYVATGEPMTKAGAYGLMNLAAVLVESIEGDFYSVIGLPLNKIHIELKKLGVNVLKQ
jgi:septum formation protein